MSFFDKKNKSWKLFLNFSVFAGVVPIGISGAITINLANNSSRADDLAALDYKESPLKFTDKNNVDYYVSLRSNPMNNFVSLTTEDGQYTYALCDTAKTLTGINYAYNSGIAKFDNTGKLVDLWVMPASRNSNLYTTNIVFGDSENTLYVLAGIRNPAKALNDVYGNAVVPTKINYDSYEDPSDTDTAYFIRQPVPITWNFQPQPDSKYRVDITNYRFDTYTPIKIFKLNASNLSTAVDQYKFEFPPAAAINEKGSDDVVSEYDKTIIAGFGGGQHLNYWSTNATFIANYGQDGRSFTSGNIRLSIMTTPLMNSSFFHYLQYGQTFDYLGNDQFLMVPKYIGIDPNIGGLYSLVSKITGSLASLSNYMSLYDALWRYVGKPSVSNKAVDFNSNSVSNYQYEYLDGLGRIINVGLDSEFALKSSVVYLILLSIGYFLSSESGYVWQSWNGWGTDITQLSKDSSVPASTLTNYGVICFSPLQNDAVNKYKLYLFTRYLRNFSSNWYRPGLLQYTFDNMLITKGSDGKKRYAFYLKSSHWGYSEYDYSNGADYYNYSPNDSFLYGLGTANGSDYEMQKKGLTWEEFSTKYDNIENSQRKADESSYDNSSVHKFTELRLTGVNLNSYNWSNHTTNSRYYGYLNSIYSYNGYDSNKAVLGFNSIDAYNERPFFRSSVTETKMMDSDTVNGMQYAAYGSSSGSKYIIFNNKVIMSDPVWLNTLTLFDANDLTTMGENYSNSYLDASSTIAYQYAEYPKSASSYRRISTLFLLPNNKGFGYMDYKGKVYLCENSALPNVLTASNFKTLNKLDSSSVTSFVPVADKFFVSVLGNNGTISNWIYGDSTNIPDINNPGTDNPGTDNPGTDNPGTDNPGTDNPGTDNPGTDNPGTDNPIDGPGNNNSRGDSVTWGIIWTTVATVSLTAISISTWLLIRRYKLKKINKRLSLAPLKNLSNTRPSNSALYPVPRVSYNQSRLPIQRVSYNQSRPPVLSQSPYSNRPKPVLHPHPAQYSNGYRGTPSTPPRVHLNNRRFV